MAWFPLARRRLARRVAIGTVVAKNYLPAARVLAASLRRHHPGAVLHVLLTDEPDGEFDPGREPFQTIRLDEIRMPGHRQLAFRYDRTQLAVAAKPHLLGHLLSLGYRAALYLDSDGIVAADLSPLLRLALEHDLVLTPHLLAPLESDDAVGRELNILQSGVFNAGLVAVRGSPDALGFLAWWQERVRSECRHAVGEGVFGDQKWLDLAPSLLADTHVVRDPGYNVGHWNLRERPVTGARGSLRVGDRPCRYFHFSGFDPRQPSQLSRYAPGAEADEGTAAAGLFRSYAAELLGAGYEAANAWPYAFGRFANGVAVTPILREIHAALGDDAERFGDPFATGAGSFFAWLAGPAEGDAGAPPVSRLWNEIHRRRGDVQRVFPEPLGADRDGYLAWAAAHGAAEHDVPQALVPGGAAERSP